MGFTEQSAIPAESTSNNFPVVKPAEKPYLRSRISHLLAQAETEPDNLERWTIYQHIRELCRGLNKQNGYLTWFATAVVLLAGGFLLAAIVHNWPKSYFYTYPTNYLRIIQKIDAATFVVQRVENGQAQEETHVRFCSDYLPRFEAGHVLAWIRYNDLGKCQSVAPEDRGYDVLYGSNSLPVLAPNCKFDFVNDHIVCEGGRAKFD